MNTADDEDDDIEVSKPTAPWMSKQSKKQTKPKSPYTTPKSSPKSSPKTSPKGDNPPRSPRIPRNPRFEPPQKTDTPPKSPRREDLTKGASQVSVDVNYTEKENSSRPAWLSRLKSKPGMQQKEATTEPSESQHSMMENSIDEDKTETKRPAWMTRLKSKSAMQKTLDHTNGVNGVTTLYVRE